MFKFLTYPLGFNFLRVNLVFLNFEAQQAFRIMGDIPLDASNIAASSDISVMYISSVINIIRFLNFEINEFHISVVSAVREVTLRLRTNNIDALQQRGISP